MTRRDHTHHQHLWRGKQGERGRRKAQRGIYREAERREWRWIIKIESGFETEHEDEIFLKKCHPRRRTRNTAAVEEGEEGGREGRREEMLAFDYVKHSQVWRVLRGCHPRIKDSQETHAHTHTYLTVIYWGLVWQTKKWNACVLCVWDKSSKETKLTQTWRHSFGLVCVCVCGGIAAMNGWLLRWITDGL